MTITATYPPVMPWSMHGLLTAPLWLPAAISSIRPMEQEP